MGAPKPQCHLEAPKSSVPRVLHVLEPLCLQTPLASSATQAFICIACICWEMHNPWHRRWNTRLGDKSCRMNFRRHHLVVIQVSERWYINSSGLQAASCVKIGDINCHLPQTFKNNCWNLCWFSRCVCLKKLWVIEPITVFVYNNLPVANWVWVRSCSLMAATFKDSKIFIMWVPSQ